jgi:hypothetical protein
MDDVRAKGGNCGDEEVSRGELDVLLMIRVPEALRSIRSCGEVWGERRMVLEPMLPPRRLCCCGGIRRGDSVSSPGIFFCDVGAVAFMLLG